VENSKAFINRKIENNAFHMAPVEIIIPFHGEISHVTKLMENIFKTVFTNRYLITLVDDCSPNKMFVEQMKKSKTPGIRCFRQNEQKGFGAAVNLALKNPWNYEIPYVLIMHSDVCPEENTWLAKLGESYLKLQQDGVKMISPLTNNPVIDSETLKANKGQKKQDIILKDEFLPMYCVLAERKLFNKIGLLKEMPYAGTEAEEFANRMKEMKYRQAACGNSWVNHEGRKTLSKLDTNKKAQEILRKAKEEFDQKQEKQTLPQ
jgi:glycosyltransferase involved in cell wall biosynthesis